MKKIILLIFISCCITCGCVSDKKLNVKILDSTDNIHGTIVDDDFYKKEDQRLADGNPPVQEEYELNLFGEKYLMKYSGSNWLVGMGWRDEYKCIEQENVDSSNYMIYMSMNPHDGTITHIYRCRFAFTNEKRYIPSLENGKKEKSNDEFRTLAKKYLEELYGKIDYSKYSIEEDYRTGMMDDETLLNPQINLVYYINGIKTLESIDLYMNQYGDFVSCNYADFDKYNSLDIDNLIDIGLLTDEAYEIAKEKIVDEYEEKVKKIEIDKGCDYFCLDEQNNPIRIIGYKITLNTGIEEAIQVVVGIED